MSTKQELVNQIVEKFKEIGTNESTNKINSYISSLSYLGVLNQLTPSQAFHFLRIAFDLKLDPLKKEIYCIPRQTKSGIVLQIVIAYQEYIKRAASHPNYQPPMVETITENDMRDWYSQVTLQRKGDSYPITRKFYLREWKQNTPIWNEKPIFMLEKTAIKNTLAWVFPELSTFIQAEETTLNNETLGYIRDLPPQIEELQPKKVAVKKAFAGETNE